MAKICQVLKHPFKTLSHLFQKRKINRFLNNISLEDIDSIDGYDFELFVSVILENCGFKCDLTTKSKDNGVDILAKKGGIILAVQTKLYYNHSVGNKGVQEVYTAKNFYGAQIAIVVTNTTFSKPAITMAQKLNVGLIGRKELGEIIKNNRKQNELFFDQLIYEKLKGLNNE